jgi:hypothetical protein
MKRTTSSALGLILAVRDRDRWSDNRNIIPISSMRWSFVSSNCSHCASPSCLSITISYANGQRQNGFHIHNNLALMLAYLDLDYWLTPLKPIKPSNRNRITRYLERLREDVILELTNVPEDVRRDPCFGPKVLQEWAVRVHDEYGHSNTGRKLYLTFCEKRGESPYHADFLNFGKKHAAN